MKRVCVLGLGYIGLPTAAVLATHGFDVHGTDTNHRVLKTLNDGDVHIQEPGLKTLVQAAFKSGNMKAHPAPGPADVFIIAVPTPVTAEKRPELSYVQAAAHSIVPHLRPGNLVILESTVPPGTTQRLVAPLLEESGLKAGRDFFLAHCPERVLPGAVLTEIVRNDRIIGGIDEASAKRAEEVYRTFVSGTIYLTDATTAEMVKLAENTFRDVNIALANELARVCQAVGVDVWDVIELANKHPRVRLHRPGPGVGGHCIPLDPWFLVAVAPETARLIRLAREVNDSQPALVVQAVLQLLGYGPDPRVAVLGVAYKANVDDARESPAIPVILGLEKAGVQVRVCDPHVQSFLRPLHTVEKALDGADAAVLLTDHREFVDLDPAVTAEHMRGRKVLDTRNCLDVRRWRDAGFVLVRLGVGAAPPVK